MSNIANDLSKVAEESKNNKINSFIEEQVLSIKEKAAALAKEGGSSLITHITFDSSLFKEGPDVNILVNERIVSSLQAMGFTIELAPVAAFKNSYADIKVSW